MSLATDHWPLTTTSSKRRLKRVLDVTDHRRLARWPEDCDHVEPRRRLRLAVAAQVKRRCLAELVHLDLVDLRFGRGLIKHARLDLDEDQCLTVARDDVDLADSTFEVAVEDAVTLFLKLAGGEILPAIAQGIF